MTPPDFKQARQSLGLTQQQLADTLDCSLSSIGKWERGEVVIPVVVALAMTALRAGERGK